MEKQRILAIIGYIAVLPALLLVVSGMSGLAEPIPGLSHPVVILGGLALALAINTLSVLRASGHFEDNNFVAGITIRVRDSLLNLGVIFIGFTLLGTIAVYLFLENFMPFKTWAERCAAMIG